MKVVRWVGLLVAAAAVGCGNSTSPKTSYSYVDADQASAAKTGRAFEDPSKISAKNAVTKADLAKLQKAATAAKKSMAANPNEATKKTYVDATVDLGMATMYSAELDRHEKYSTALRLFRAALAVDPNNPDAKSAAQTIVDIYTQMGRPVPK